MKRIARLLARALRLGQAIGQLAEKKRLLLAKAQGLGLAMNQPIVLENGEQWCLVKPTGGFVFYKDVDLKPVPKFTRKPKEPAVAPSTSEPADVLA